MQTNYFSQFIITCHSARLNLKWDGKIMYKSIWAQSTSNTKTQCTALKISHESIQFWNQNYLVISFSDDQTFMKLFNLITGPVIMMCNEWKEWLYLSWPSVISLTRDTPTFNQQSSVSHSVSTSLWLCLHDVCKLYIDSQEPAWGSEEQPWHQQSSLFLYIFHTPLQMIALQQASWKFFINIEHIELNSI